MPLLQDVRCHGAEDTGTGYWVGPGHSEHPSFRPTTSASAGGAGGGHGVGGGGDSTTVHPQSERDLDALAKHRHDQFLAERRREGSDNEASDDGGGYGGGYGGFSSADVNEVLCQGVKPWDDDAGAVLMGLNGGGGDY